MSGPCQGHVRSCQGHVESGHPDLEPKTASLFAGGKPKDTLCAMPEAAPDGPQNADSDTARKPKCSPGPCQKRAQNEGLFGAKRRIRHGSKAKVLPCAMSEEGSERRTFRRKTQNSAPHENQSVPLGHVRRGLKTTDFSAQRVYTDTLGTPIFRDTCNAPRFDKCRFSCFCIPTIRVQGILVWIFGGRKTFSQIGFALF